MVEGETDTRSGLWRWFRLHFSFKTNQMFRNDLVSFWYLKIFEAEMNCEDHHHHHLDVMNSNSEAPSKFIIWTVWATYAILIWLNFVKCSFLKWISSVFWLEFVLFSWLWAVIASFLLEMLYWDFLYKHLCFSFIPKIIFILLTKSWFDFRKSFDLQSWF